MPLALFDAHVDKLPVLQAEDALQAAVVSALPHMTSTDRGAAIREWRSVLGPRGVTRPRSSGEMAAVATAVGIGVEIVPR